MRALLPLVLLASPALAAAQPMYRVGLAAPVTTVAIVKDVRWICAGSTCQAPNTATAPAGNVCAGVVRRLGPVTSFSAGDRTFDAAEIEKCNAAAK